MKGLGERLPPKVLDHCLHSGFAATVIPWDIVLCNVKYKWTTDSCDSYLHVIMTLRPAALHSCPYGLILSFSLRRPASSMVGFWQLLCFFLFVFFWGGEGSLSPPRLNIFTVGNMGVMIYLSQGGLRSLSASSWKFFLLSK